MKKKFSYIAGEYINEKTVPVYVEQPLTMPSFKVESTPGTISDAWQNIRDRFHDVQVAVQNSTQYAQTMALMQNMLETQVRLSTTLFPYATGGSITNRINDRYSVERDYNERMNTTRHQMMLQGRPLKEINDHYTTLRG